MNIIYKNEIILKDVALANSFLTKLSGYMFRKQPHLPGILFKTSGSMQTTFMRFNLDIIFLNKDLEVITILRDVKPWRMTKIYSKTEQVLEVPSGIVPKQLKDGDKTGICL